MDPLSVTASVVGLVLAAGQAKTLLQELISGLQDAPSLVQHVIDEIHSITFVICSLQTFLSDEERTSRSGEAMITINHLIITLTGCVHTFSDLQTEINGLRTGNDMRTMDLLKWARKEGDISRILGRLQGHKSSLTLILNILQW